MRVLIERYRFLCVSEHSALLKFSLRSLLFDLLLLLSILFDDRVITHTVIVTSSYHEANSLPAPSWSTCRFCSCRWAAETEEQPRRQRMRRPAGGYVHGRLVVRVVPCRCRWRQLRGRGNPVFLQCNDGKQLHRLQLLRVVPRRLWRRQLRPVWHAVHMQPDDGARLHCSHLLPVVP